MRDHVLSELVNSETKQYFEVFRVCYALMLYLHLSDLYTFGRTASKYIASSATDKFFFTLSHYATFRQRVDIT